MSLKILHSQIPLEFKKKHTRACLNRCLVDTWQAYLAVELHGSHELFSGVLLFSTSSDLADATKVACF